MMLVCVNDCHVGSISRLQGFSPVATAARVMLSTFWEGFLILGTADRRPEGCLELICSTAASVIIRLSRSMSCIWPVTIYFHINKIESWIKKKKSGHLVS